MLKNFKINIIIFILFIFSCARHNIHIDTINYNTTNGWWHIFNDYDLNNLINLALKQNLDIKLAEKNIEIARANYYIERSYLFPTLNLTGSSTRYKRYLRGLPKFIPSKIKESQYNLSIDVNYEIDFWQKNYLKAKSKEIIELIESYKREIIEKSLISEICSFYFELKKQITIKKILNKMLKIYKKELEILKEKFSKGLINVEKLRELKIKIQSIKEMEFVVTNSIQVLKHNLNVLSGNKPDKILNIDHNFKYVEIKVPDNISSKSLLNRPDIKIALNTIIVNKKLLKVAKSSYFPQFYLTTSYGYESGKIRNLIRNYNSLYNLTLNFLQSVFDFGKKRNLVKVSKLEIEKANLNFSNVMLKALKEINDSFSTIENLRSKREKLLLELNELKQILINLNDKFSKGFIPIEELYEIKIKILEKRIDIITDEKEIYDNIIKLYKALGY